MDVDGAIQEWEGLTEEILNEGDWFEKWWQGEKECELNMPLKKTRDRPNANLPRSGSCD
jgi:hypothetical protein